jgi:hypothetical protein
VIASDFLLWLSFSFLCFCNYKASLWLTCLCAS